MYSNTADWEGETPMGNQTIFEPTEKLLLVVTCGGAGQFTASGCTISGIKSAIKIAEQHRYEYQMYINGFAYLIEKEKGATMTVTINRSGTSTLGSATYTAIY